jgi:hypothetical protein
MNDLSVLQCWQLTEPLTTTSPFINSVNPATQLLGNIANASYMFLTSNITGTPHPAPVVQYVSLLCNSWRGFCGFSSFRYVILMSGSLLVTFPDSTEKASFQPVPSNLFTCTSPELEAQLARFTGESHWLHITSIRRDKYKIPFKAVPGNGMLDIFDRVGRKYELVAVEVIKLAIFGALGFK